MTTRTEVYAAIDTEREYQDHIWPQSEGAELSPPHTVGEDILLLDEYVQRARALWTEEPKPESDTLNFIRKIAAIAVRCMEQHGAPKR